MTAPSTGRFMVAAQQAGTAALLGQDPVVEFPLQLFAAAPAGNAQDRQHQTLPATSSECLRVTPVLWGMHWPGAGWLQERAASAQQNESDCCQCCLLGVFACILVGAQRTAEFESKRRVCKCCDFHWLRKHTFLSSFVFINNCIILEF